jgi:predicted RNA-binding protein with PIN domain
VPPPPALRPYLTFARLTPRSLDAIARVVDGDAAFRARVADAVDEDEVGRAGWLWLARPDGWDDELASLEADSTARAADAAEQREERAASRRLAATQAALARAEEAATQAAADLAALRADVAAERDARHAAEALLADGRARAEQLVGERRDVVRNLKDRDARLTERGTQLNAARARITALEAEVRALGRTGVPHAGHPEPAAPEVPGTTPTAVPDGPGTAPAAPASVPPPAVAVPAVVVTGVAHAAAAAASLADALAAVAEALEQAAGAVEGTRVDAGAGLGVADPASPAGAPAAGLAPAPPLAGLPPEDRAARIPLSLPGGVFDDSVEAAEHLLRTPNAVLVVDGYNVTMTGWPELPKAEQRRRLVVEVSELAHRTSTPVELVFDGAEVEPLPVPAPLRALVRVRFSDPGVEADDVIIDMVGRIPAATPVIVASSDNRVRAGVRRRGANVIHAVQLVAVLRR